MADLRHDKIQFSSFSSCCLNGIFSWRKTFGTLTQKRRVTNTNLLLLLNVPRPLKWITTVKKLLPKDTCWVNPKPWQRFGINQVNDLSHDIMNVRRLSLSAVEMHWRKNVNTYIFNDTYWGLEVWGLVGFNENNGDKWASNFW